VLLATGEATEEARTQWGLATSKRGITIHRHSYETSEAGIFAAGGAVTPTGTMAVRAVGHGREAMIAIDQYLRGLPVTGPHRPFNSRLGKLKEGEIARFMPEASDAPRIDPAGGADAGLSDQEAPAEAGRCLHCDCRKPSNCKLREYADLYRANQGRFKGERRLFEQSRQHAAVIYEPGKCINCGICIRIAAKAREPLGLTFLGRGFDVRVGVPFSSSLQEGLTKAAVECVRACPTGALAFKNA
jgi:ferredoxin